MDNLRLHRIIDFAKERKSCSIAELMEEFGVSSATTRFIARRKAPDMKLCTIVLASSIYCIACGLVAAEPLSLDGSWDFRFEEGKSLEAAATPEFAATDTIPVPACYDMMPKWYMKRGTGLYRRSFTLSKPMKDAVLVVDGMGVRAKFAIDGKDLGMHPYPYARLEIPVGHLAAGEHVVFAAIDNILSWPRVKLARPYYDFYFYGGFYHGVKLVEREPKVFVRTLDYKTGKVEVEIEGVSKEVRTIKDFKLWSPEEPNLTTIDVAGRKVRFGIRQIEAKDRKLYLNGKELGAERVDLAHHVEHSPRGDQRVVEVDQRLRAFDSPFGRHRGGQFAERDLQIVLGRALIARTEQLPLVRPVEPIGGAAAERTEKDAAFLQPFKLTRAGRAQRAQDGRGTAGKDERLEELLRLRAALHHRVRRGALRQFVDHIGAAGRLQGSSWQVVVECRRRAFECERERPQEFNKTFLSGREVFSLKKFRSDHFIHRRFGYNEKHPRENIFRAFAHYMPTRGKKERSNRAS